MGILGQQVHGLRDGRSVGLPGKEAGGVQRVNSSPREGLEVGEPCVLRPGARSHQRACVRNRGGQGPRAPGSSCVRLEGRASACGPRTTRALSWHRRGNRKCPARLGTQGWKETDCFSPDGEGGGG